MKKETPLLWIAIAGVLSTLFLFSSRPTRDPEGRGKNESDPKARTWEVESIRQPAQIPGPSPTVSNSSGQASAHGPGSQPSPGVSLEDYLNKKYPGDWRSLKTDDGRISSIMGGMIPEAGKSTGSALRLARELAPFLGADAGEIKSEPLQTDTSPRSLSYIYGQEVLGFEVYYGAITVLARTSDGSVYMVNNDLRNVDLGNTDIRVTAAEAVRSLEERYADRDPSIEQKKKNPVVWADGKPNELAWVFLVTLPKPTFDKLEVLVGARSGRILHEKTVLMH